MVSDLGKELVLSGDLPTLTGECEIGAETERESAVDGIQYSGASRRVNDELCYVGGCLSTDDAQVSQSLRASDYTFCCYLTLIN